MSASDDSVPDTYVYDSANQLIRENNQTSDLTYTWTYDNTGNILERKEYAYTSGSLDGITPTDTITYTYGDKDWGDLLTNYDGQALTYDDIGNLTSDGTWTYTWKHGRQLASMTDGTATWNYTYGASGLRTNRTDGTTNYRYVYDGDKLTFMARNGLYLRFAYTPDGTPLSVLYNGTLYYYVTNLQGDVTAIRTANRQQVVTYTYDAWGNVTTSTTSAYNYLSVMNPLRYRGYVYDAETRLYYLQSRYYNPEWGRFINADVYIATGQGLVGNNMFVYCNNNPANYKDPNGREPVSVSVIAGVITVVICFAGVVVAVYSAVMALWELGSWVAELIQTVQTEISYAKEVEEPEPPDVTYPGDDPKKAPDGYEWRGPDEQGGKRGGYANPNGKDSWHPDLDHPDGVKPHWDYNDGLGHKWRVFPDHIEFAPK